VILFEKDRDDGETREVWLMGRCNLIGHLNCVGIIRIRISCDCVVLI